MGEQGSEGRLAAFLVRWVDAVRLHPVRVLVPALLFTLLCGAYTASELGVNSDTEAIFDESLDFRQRYAELTEAFPQLADTFLLVLEAPTEAGASDAAEAVAAALRADRDHFAEVYVPGGGSFFRRHGLLYLETDELQQLTEDLVAAQPFLAELSRDPSLRGVLAPLTLALERDPEALAAVDLRALFLEIERALEASRQLRTRPAAFDALLLGDADDGGPVRRYVIVQPRLDFGALVATEAAMQRLDGILGGLGLRGEDERRARITGYLALNQEELEVVERQATLAGIASFVLVVGILFAALRSARLVLATAVSLVFGLVWTAAFATLAVGHLNMISVAFAVLFIGLSVDFGIHLCLRFRELRCRGLERDAALRETASSVGGSLLLCALTTAIGFYAFLPTSYRGVAELGLIAGTGMFISVFCSLTVMPAILALGREPGAPARSARAAGALFSLPLRHPATVVGAAALVGLGSALLLREIHFDPSPLRIRDPGTESVQTFRDLVSGGDLNPFTAEILAADLEAADAMAERLRALPTVERVVTLSDYVPEEQQQKLAILEDADLVLNLAPPGTQLPPPDPAEQVRALKRFRAALGGADLSPVDPELRTAAERLGVEMDHFQRRLDEAEHPETLLARLDENLVDSLARRVEDLRLGLQAGPVTHRTLPVDLVSRLVAEDGRARLQVFPSEDLNDVPALARFAADVRSVEAAATGESIYILESGRAIVDALRQAFAAAFVLISALLLLLWRSTRDAALVLVPLVLAALATGAGSVLLGIPINFADVIVLPLLLGIGVDSGIHLVHRHRLDTRRQLLETSTPRAVFWSALTTTASFGSLGLSTHGGMASLGQLLSLGVLLTLLANLLVLPALIALVDRRRSGGWSGAESPS